MARIVDFAQDAIDDLTIVSGKRSLWFDRFAHRIALDLKPGLDACREIETGEGLIDAPEFALQCHRLLPLSRSAELVQSHTLARNDAGRTRNPTDAANQHHRSGDMRRRREDLHVWRAIHNRQEPPGVRRGVFDVLDARMLRETRYDVEREIATLELGIRVEHDWNVDRIGYCTKIRFDLGVVEREISFKDCEN